MRRGSAYRAAIGYLSSGRWASYLADLPQQLLGSGSGLIQCDFALASCQVALPHLAADHTLLYLEIALALKAVKDGVQRAGAEAVTMAIQLLDQPQPVDRLVAGMIENVQFDEPQE